jgi:hypothetical protein
MAEELILVHFWILIEIFLTNGKNVIIKNPVFSASGEFTEP